MATRNEASAGVTAGILSLFLISYGISYIQVIISELAAVFPDVPISSLSYIMAIAPLGGIIGALGSGALTSRRIVGYKPLAIIGTLFFLIGGALPFFYRSSFAFILACRFVLGIGMGSMSVLANPLVNAFYEGDARAKMLSAGAAVAQIGAVIMQLFAGILGDIDIWYAFLADALSILSVIGAIFLIKEPEADAVETAKTERGKLSGRVWYVFFIFALSTLAVCPLLFGVSFLAARFTDSLTVTATVQMTYSISMAVGGAIYAVAFKYLKRRVVGVACLLTAAGMSLVMLAPNLACMYIGEVLTALGYGSILPAVMQLAGVTVEPRLVGFATSIIMTGMQLSTFITAPFMNAIEAITGDGVFAPCFVGIAMFVVIGIMTLIASPYPKDVMERLKSSAA